jgi:myosin-5
MEVLLNNLFIPPPGSKSAKVRKEVFFSAHLLGSLLFEYVKNDMIDTLSDLFNRVTTEIHELTRLFKEDYVSFFWLANNFELICVIQHQIEKLQSAKKSNQSEQSAYVVLAGINDDLRIVIYESHNVWLRDFLKRLNVMIIPAIVENQSLPGYVCKQNSGLWSAWATSVTTSLVTVDQLLDFLIKLEKTLKAYYVEESMSNQIMAELIRVIGVTAFNHLVTRKSFLTWKRGDFIFNKACKYNIMFLG